MLELQTEIRDTSDHLKDLMQLTSLNLQALDLVTKSKHKGIIGQFLMIQQQFKVCQSFRLQYLIKNQIFLEGDIERRDRMKDYEDKIQIQRRLIMDKQTNYLSLSRKKNLKSMYFSPEDYAVVQITRRKKQKQVNTLLYKNDITVINLIKTKYQKQQEQLLEYSTRLKSYQSNLLTIQRHKEHIENKSEEYLKFINAIDSSINQEKYTETKNKIQTINMNCNDLINAYLQKTHQIKKQNQQLMARLKAKKSYTKTLQQQNVALLNKLSKRDIKSLSKQNESKEQKEFVIESTGLKLGSLTTRF